MKTTSITFRCTIDQKKRMSKLAKLEKLSLSDYIKSKALNQKIIYHDVIKECDNLIRGKNGKHKTYKKKYVVSKKEYVEKEPKNIYLIFDYTGVFGYEVSHPDIIAVFSDEDEAEDYIKKEDKYDNYSCYEYEIED